MAEEAAVFAIELGRTFVADLEGCTGGMETIAQHQAPRRLKPQLFLILQRTLGSELNVGDTTFDPSIAMATYDAGAKMKWHAHPVGQVLLITEGTGYYQERGTSIQVVHSTETLGVSYLVTKTEQARAPLPLLLAATRLSLPDQSYRSPAG
ncbi:MAG TPA: hypothetical protein VMH04_11965 [Candidatus Solibacter sp.]|nr:hypothetical protein [Candidatus Solibacter sp.]